ncbi:MAG: putative lipid II flippase FtsW [Candidatus Binatia bacterium]|nr:putative lipid II flippase FtsW [Candidatus Binatia bacterium]
MIARSAPMRPSYDLGQRPAVLATHRVDRWLLGALGLLVALGLLLVLDASFFVGAEMYGDPYAIARRQLGFAMVAIAEAALLTRVRSDVFRKLAYPSLILVLLLLAVVLIPEIGQVRNGARRWIAVGSMAFQPSELAKVAMVLYLAHSLARKEKRMGSFSYGVAPHLIVAAFPAGLLLLEPDFGTAGLLVALVFAMLFVGGARLSHLAGLVLLVVPPAFWLVWSSTYRWNRVVGFLDPFADPRGNGFQLVQSFLAFGNGGVTGVGLGAGKQKLFWIPEGHTDFIFALLGESLGLLGAVFVLCCFGMIAFRGFAVAARSLDRFSSLLAFGVTFLLVAQAVLNIAVVLGVVPTKGMPLPLLSYGGSSMLTTGLLVGILLSLSRETR